MSNPESEEEFESAQEDDNEPSQERDEANAAAIEASTVTEDEKASDSNEAAIEEEPGKDEVAKEPDKDEVATKPDVKTAEEEKSDSATDTEDQQEKEPDKDEVAKEADVKTAAEEKSDSPTETEDQEIEAKDIRHALKSLVKEEKPKESGWGGWGSWLSSTVGAVADSASALGHGIQSAIHTVEESLGVPQPESLAKENSAKEVSPASTPVEDEPKHEDNPETTTTENVPAAAGDKDKDEGLFSIFSGVGALGSALAEKSGQFVSGGIDALEALGRKTMDVISEGDPGLRQKRAALAELTGTAGPALSQVLREAKAKAELSATEKPDVVPLAHFSTLFDDCQGFVHLEALELLSTESSAKLQMQLLSLDDEKDKTIFDELQKIKDACKIEEEEEVEKPAEKIDFGEEIRSHVESLKIPYDARKLIEAEGKIRREIEAFGSEEDSESTPESLYKSGMRCLAELTSKTVEFLRKSSELILLPCEKDAEKSPLGRGQALSRITAITCQVVSSVSSQCAEKMNEIIAKLEDPSDDVKGLVPSLYLEASNCTTYIQDALQLLQSILQLSFIQHRDAAVE